MPWLRGNKLFQPLSTSVWNNFISASGNFSEIISEAYCSSWIFCNVFSVVKEFWNNFRTLSAAEIILFQLQRWSDVKENTTQHNIQLAINQACCVKAQMDFIPPSLWPSNSPDLKPVDLVVSWFCRTAFTGTVSRTWRLWACLTAEGGHFVHALWTWLLCFVL